MTFSAAYILLISAPALYSYGKQDSGHVHTGADAKDRELARHDGQHTGRRRAELRSLAAPVDAYAGPGAVYQGARMTVILVGLGMNPSTAGLNPIKLKYPKHPFSSSA